MNFDATTSNAADPANGDAWEPCPAGALEGLANRLHAADRRRQQVTVAKTAGVVTLMTAVLVVGGGLLSGLGNGGLGNGGAGNQGPMLCNECLATFEAYEWHLTDQQAMQPDQVARMEAHLEKCDLCRNKFEQEHPGLLASLVEMAQRMVASAVSLFTPTSA
ncbi:MAG: hypothetical protein AAF589_04310 [Planctomycetota bacterium]